MLTSALHWEWRSSTNVTKGKRTGGGHMPGPSLLLRHLPNVSSVNILTSSRVFRLNSCTASLANFARTGFCVAAPQDIHLHSLTRCQLLRGDATNFSPSHFNPSLLGWRLYPLNVSRHLQAANWAKQRSIFVTIWDLDLTDWDNRRRGLTRLTHSQSARADFFHSSSLSDCQGVFFCSLEQDFLSKDCAL